MDTTKAYRSALQCDTSPQTTWSVSGGSSWCPNLAIQQPALQRRSLGPHFLYRRLLVCYDSSLGLHRRLLVCYDSSLGLHDISLGFHRRLLGLELFLLTAYQRRQFLQLVPLVRDYFLLDAVRRPQRVVVL